MPIAQGINKLTVAKKQTALGTPATGSGGQVIRREQSNFQLAKDTYENNEIVQHQQSTGITHGVRSSTGSINGVISPATYAQFTASLTRKAFAATTPISAASITIAGTAPTNTLTRAAGSFLTDGIKIGDVVRLTAGTFNVANSNNNLLVTNVTATVLTVVVVNGSTLVNEGPITGATLTVIGKKTLVPLTGHTQEYWTIEEYFSDISRSELYTDCVVASMDIGLPSTGNATISTSFAGLNSSIGATQILTTPTSATTTNVLTAVNGVVMVNGTKVGNITGAQIKIDCSAANMGAVIGSNFSPDIQRGRVKVSGQLTAFFQDGAISTLWDAGTLFNIIVVCADGSAANADFVTFSMSAVKLSSEGDDDGEKGIVKTYQFTAQLNAAGGAALANDQTIITIQDSQAP